MVKHPFVKHQGPATYICDAAAVSKGFRRLRTGHDVVSRGIQDLSTAIQEASAQRDITFSMDRQPRREHNAFLLTPPRHG